MFRFQGNLKKKGLPIESKTWEIAYEDMEFLKTLGKGSFGTVYHGMYFGTDVAIKQINDDDEKYLEREVAILKDIRHPNIVQLMGICEHETGLYLVTELLPGGTLRKKLKNKAIDLHWSLRVDISIQISRALTYLHSKGIIHRDLKSKNVLVDEYYKIKVCDFGLARTLESDGVPRRMTICGTEDWIAPEIGQGQVYDDRADVFSLGIVMLEIIFREKPNEDNIHHNVSRGVDMLHAKQNLPRDTPAPFATLTFRCCAYDMEARPSIAIVLKELKAMATPVQLPLQINQPSQAVLSLPIKTPTSPSAMAKQLEAASIAPPPPPPPLPPSTSFRVAAAPESKPTSPVVEDTDEKLIETALKSTRMSSRRGNTLRDPISWTSFEPSSPPAQKPPPSPKVSDFASSIPSSSDISSPHDTKQDHAPPKLSAVPPRASKPRPMGAPPPRPMSIEVAPVNPAIQAESVASSSPKTPHSRPRIQESFRVHSPKAEQSFEIFVNPLADHSGAEITAQDLDGAPLPESKPTTPKAGAKQSNVPKVSFVKRMFGKQKTNS